MAGKGVGAAQTDSIGGLLRGEGYVRGPARAACPAQRSLGGEVTHAGRERPATPEHMKRWSRTAREEPGVRAAPRGGVPALDERTRYGVKSVSDDSAQALLAPASAASPLREFVEAQKGSHGSGDDRARACRGADAGRAQSCLACARPGGWIRHPHPR